MVSAAKILTRSEVEQVLKDLHRRKRHVNPWQNQIVFRLATCCGLRVSEMAALNLNDITIDGARPAIRVRASTTKGRAGRKRGRLVPLWWDSGTLHDIALWKRFRETQEAKPDDPFLCGQTNKSFPKRRDRINLAVRWKDAIRSLGKERVQQLSIHCGRHSFASHALFIGRSMVEVRDALGHRSISTTSLYSHLLERENVGQLFNFGG